MVTKRSERTKNEKGLFNRAFVFPVIQQPSFTLFYMDNESCKESLLSLLFRKPDFRKLRPRCISFSIEVSTRVNFKDNFILIKNLK